MSRLAIVIPAYKDMYFDQALSSIVNQTNKDFTLYIGDDCSPSNLYDSVKKYEDLVPVVYKRFDENMGGKDLVSHWQRCIDLVHDEEWIWLFSDDDIMEENCVKSFYNAVRNFPEIDLFHFNVNMIDHDSNVVSSCSFPELLTSEEFFYGRINSLYRSYVVEYIFRKSHFINEGGFENFDLGWGSDDALWIKLGMSRGIKTIENAKVFWRRSAYNISFTTDEKILKRKFYAKIEYSAWIFQQAKDNRIKIETNHIQNVLIKRFLREIKEHCENLSYKLIYELLFRYSGSVRVPCFTLNLLYLYCYKIYRNVVRQSKRLLPALATYKPSISK